MHVQPRSPRQFCSKACYARSTVETLPEAAAREALSSLGIAYEQEARRGRYSIDFLIGDSIALEIDGTYWHRHPERDQKKNAYLEGIGLTVVRVVAEELMATDDRVSFMRQALAEPLPLAAQ